MATAQEQRSIRLNLQGVSVPAPKAEVLEITHDQTSVAQIVEGDVNPVSRQSSRVQALQVKGFRELDFANSTAQFWQTVYENPDLAPEWREKTPFERIQQSLAEEQGLIPSNVEAPEPVTLDILNIEELVSEAKTRKGVPVFGPIEDRIHGIYGWAEVTARDEIDGDLVDDGDSINGYGIVLLGESVASRLRGVSNINILWTHDPGQLKSGEESKVIDPNPAAVQNTLTPLPVHDRPQEGPVAPTFNGGNPFVGSPITDFDRYVTYVKPPSDSDEN